MKDALGVKEVSKSLGIGRETLRFYERIGLLPPPGRTSSGYRKYPKKILNRLRFIKKAQEVGFTLREITSLLRLKLGSATTCASVEKIAEAKIEEINGKIAALRAMKRSLGRFSEVCRRSDQSKQCSWFTDVLADEKLFTCNERRNYVDVP